MKPNNLSIYRGTPVPPAGRGTVGYTPNLRKRQEEHVGELGEYLERRLVLTGRGVDAGQPGQGRRNGQPAVECFGGIRRRKRYMLRVSEI